MQLILPFVLKLGILALFSLHIHVSTITVDFKSHQCCSYIYVAVLCHPTCISECKPGCVGAFMFWVLTLRTAVELCKICRKKLAEGWTDKLTNGYEPHQCDLDQRFGSGFVLAVLNRLLDGNVAIQWNGTKVHDGCSRKKHIKEEPDGAEKLRKRPSRV